MKNKILPLSLVTLVVCLGAFLISATVSFPDSYNPFSGDDQGSKAIKASEQYLAKLRNNQVSGLLNPADVINAREQADKLTTKNGTLEDLEWSFLGPDNVGGRTRALIFDNSDATSSTIIAGAVSGGLYKSTNVGLTWVKINGEESNLNVSCMTQATDGTIYVGTGESFAVGQYSVFGNYGYQGAFVGTGIYKSTDGENFTLLPSSAPTANSDTVAFAYINRLAVNPNDNVVYAATNKGVWYSSDAGLTWNLARVGDQEFLIGPSCDVKIGTDGITAVCVNGLAYISDAGHPNQFVLRSSDSTNLPFENVGRVELAIAPSDPSILYAQVVDNNGALINTYRSDDRGVNWRIIIPGGGNLGIGLYSNVLTVFPDDPDRIYLGFYDMWEARKINETGFFSMTRRSLGFIVEDLEPFYLQNIHHIYVFRPNGTNQVFIGHDGGISEGNIISENIEFVERSKTYTTSQFSTIGMSGTDKVVLGGAYSGGVRYINGDGNPATAKKGEQILDDFRPSGGDGGESFISLIDPNVFIYSQIPGTYMVRSEDMGDNISTDFLSESITNPIDAYKMPCLYWESFENESSRDSALFVTDKELLSGEEVMVHSNNQGYPFPYTLTEVMNPGDTIKIKDIVSTKFFIGSQNAVWMTMKTLDFSKVPEWFKIIELLGSPSCLGMSEDANYLYVGTFEGDLYRLGNIKYAYDFDRADVSSPYYVISNTVIDLPNMNGQAVTSVSIDPQNSAHVIVTLGNYGNDQYVFRTTNGLDESPTFVSVQGNLPKMPVYSSVIEMSSSNKVIIGTDMGMYISHDINVASPTWAFVDGEIGKVPVFQLKQQIIAQNPVSIRVLTGADTNTMIRTYPGTENWGVMYAATFGRGLHMSKKFEKPVGIFTPEVVTQVASIKVFPNPVNTQATIEYSLDEKTEIMIAVFNINGKMVSSEYISQSAGTHQYKLDCSSLPTGTYITSVHTGQAIKTGKFIVVH